MNINNEEYCFNSFFRFSKNLKQKGFDIYVLNPDKGGQIIIGTDEDKIVGIVILNNTGMKDYIPENILVYIAIDNSQRGKGYGKKLMEKAISSVEGNIALHVEPDNPAKHLYEKLGFNNKYLEMRFNKKK